MLALEVLQLPFRRKQQDAALLAIRSNRGLASQQRDRPRGIPDPSRNRVCRRLDLNLHAVLGAQTAGDHVELQRPDDADDRLAAAGGDIEHLHQPFLFELPEPLVELLVARILQTDTAEVLRREARNIDEPQGCAGVKRIADRELSGVDEAENVACVSQVDRLALAAEEAIGA